jgi:molecular chaperone Hsp33
VRDLLGEAVAAAVLLASTLKFAGTLTLQLQGDGAVRLLVAQCSHDFRVRAVARFDAARVAAAANDFAALKGSAQITVTLEAQQGDARYQGIVPADGTSLSACLELYFANSEQLPTALRLAANVGAVAGLLVQRVPAQGGKPAAVAVPAREQLRRGVRCAGCCRSG